MTNRLEALPAAVVVLAAGGSTRLGHPKQLVVYEGETLLRRAVKTALAAEPRSVTVVLGGHADASERALVGLGVAVVYNIDWSAGIGTSIRAGIASVLAQGNRPADEAALLMVCDQPFVTAAHLRALGDGLACGDCDAVASTYDDALGVPALFAPELFDQLLALGPDEGAKLVLSRSRQRLRRVALAHGGIDVDTAADVERLIHG